MNPSRPLLDPTETRRTSPVKLTLVLAWAAGLALLLIVMGTLLHGKTGFEKTATALTFPVQAAWLLLGGWTLQSLSRLVRKQRPRPQFFVPLLLWSLFTLSGSTLSGDACFRYLETQESVYNPHADPPLDLLVVLGGATSLGPSRAEVADSGDRVLLAAQLFQQGRVNRLITTGSALLPQSDRPTSPAEQTIEIWTALGIPQSAIETLPGANTFAEIQALKQHVDEGWQAGNSTSGQPPRIGLLTSAWHLPRAMRLARAAGLTQIVPVAADHEQRQQPPAFWDYFPSANGFLRLERCQREFMAQLVNR